MNGDDPKGTKLNFKRLLLLPVALIIIAGIVMILVFYGCSDSPRRLG